MKKTKKNDFSGIVINDSIMLAVEKKKINLKNIIKRGTIWIKKKQNYY